MKTTAAASQSNEAGHEAKPRLRYVPKPKGSWRKIVGSMKDCDLFEDAMKAGAEWRERMNREGR